jgi:hypothetical protein
VGQWDSGTQYRKRICYSHLPGPVAVPNLSQVSDCAPFVSILCPNNAQFAPQGERNSFHFTRNAMTQKRARECEASAILWFVSQRLRGKISLIKLTRNPAYIPELSLNKAQPALVI